MGSKTRKERPGRQGETWRERLFDSFAELRQPDEDTEDLHMRLAVIMAAKLNGLDVRKSAEATAEVFDMLTKNDKKLRTELSMTKELLEEELSQAMKHLEQEHYAIERLTDELDRRKIRIVRLTKDYKRAIVFLFLATLGFLTSLAVLYSL